MKKLPGIKQLQYLIALHHHQHFGRAAEASFISQSTLSAAIANLEDILDAQLLERDHKTFMFTALGNLVVAKSRVVLAQLDELLEEVQNQRNPMAGTVRLGCIPTIAPFVLSDIVTQVNKNYPQLQLLLREDTSDNLLQALSDGQIDLLLLALPYETSAFHIEYLAKDAFKLIMHKALKGDVYDKDIDFWPDNSIFLLEREHCLTGHTLQVCHIKNNKKIHPFYATSLHTLTQMINSKLGVTFLPQMAINKGILAATELVYQPPASANAYREIGLAWRRTSHRQQCYQLLAALIKEVLALACNE